jgi:hypothetical protein
MHKTTGALDCVFTVTILSCTAKGQVQSGPVRTSFLCAAVVFTFNNYLPWCMPPAAATTIAIIPWPVETEAVVTPRTVEAAITPVTAPGHAESRTSPITAPGHAESRTSPITTPGHAESRRSMIPVSVSAMAVALAATAVMVHAFLARLCTLVVAVGLELL